MYGDSTHQDILKKKKDAEERRRQRLEIQGRFHVTRIPAELKIGSQGLGAPAEVIPARLFSVDLRPNLLRLLVPYSLPEDQKASVTLLVGQKRLYAKGILSTCRLVTRSLGIISTGEQYPFRVVISLLFDSPDDKLATETAIADLISESVHSRMGRA